MVWPIYVIDRWVLIHFVCESDQLLLRPRLDHVSLPASAAVAADREMRRDGDGPASHLGSLALPRRETTEGWGDYTRWSPRISGAGIM